MPFESNFGLVFVVNRRYNNKIMIEKLLKS